MKIIDFDKKGNVVRFYLGDNNETEYWGDDWNDAPYDCNAGTVYDEFIKGHCDIAFPYDWLILEPCDGDFNTRITKEDMKNGKPCIIAIPPNMTENHRYDTDYPYWSNFKNTIKFYFEDKMEPSEELILYTDYNKR